MIETKEALKAEVAEVCRYYCFQVWNETLNQAGVEASSALRRVESGKCVLPSNHSSFKLLGPQGWNYLQGGKYWEWEPSQISPSVQSSSKEAKLLKGAEKLVEVTKEVAHDAILPPVDPKDQSKENEAPHNMEIVLATLPIPTKEDPKSKGLASSMVALT